jgi:hypothetical protein
MLGQAARHDSPPRHGWQCRRRPPGRVGQLESLDSGKPYAVARAADVPLSADMFHYMTG